MGLTAGNRESRTRMSELPGGVEWPCPGLLYQPPGLDTSCSQADPRMPTTVIRVSKGGGQGPLYSGLSGCPSPCPTKASPHR